MTHVRHFGGKIWGKPLMTHSFLCVVEGWEWRSHREFHFQVTRHV